MAKKIDVEKLWVLGIQWPFNVRQLLLGMPLKILKFKVFKIYIFSPISLLDLTQSNVLFVLSFFKDSSYVGGGSSFWPIVSYEGGKEESRRVRVSSPMLGTRKKIWGRSGCCCCCCCCCWCSVSRICYKNICYGYPAVVA